MNYSVQDGSLMVRESRNGRLIWQGMPTGKPVSKVLAIPGSNECIVLLDFEAAPSWGDFRNLIRCAPDGGVVWTAKLPESGNNAYVDVQWQIEGVSLTASTWTGWKALIDVATGALVSKDWSK